MRLIFLFLTSICWFACSSHPENSSELKSSRNIYSDIDRKFDSCMTDLTSRYPKDSLFLRPDSGKFHLSFELEKRVYIPNLNLTFEWREFNQVTHIFAPVVFIYNDSFQFVLPLTDIYYKMKNSKFTSDTTKTNKFLNFEPEVNKLISALNIQDNAELEDLLSVIMDLFHYQRISDEVDYDHFKAKAEYFLKTGGGDSNKACAPELKKSISNIKAAVKNRSTLIYTNGLGLFIFHKNKSDVKTEILNYSCFL